MIELMMLEPRSFCELILVTHAKHCDRFMPGKLYGKYTVGSDAWCWSNVCGGICRWRTCMSCFAPDGPGQCSGDRWGNRKERFLVLTTGFLSFWHIYSLAQFVISFFLPIQHVLPCTLAEIYCIMFFLTSFHIPIPRLCHIPLSMSEIVYFCAWMNDDFISERLQKHCRLWNNVRCSQTRTALGENIRQSACINNKSRGKLSAYLSRKLVRTHKICCA